MSEFETTFPITAHHFMYEPYVYTTTRSVIPPRILNQRQKRIRDRRIGHKHLRRKKGGKR